MGAKVETPEPSVIRIAQDGEGTWGKATFYITDVDIEKNPIIEVKANKCDMGSAWTLQVAPADWSEFITVIPRNSAHGTRDGNIWKAVKASKNADAWKGSTSFNLVIVIEGKNKSAWFDSFCIRAKK